MGKKSRKSPAPSSPPSAPSPSPAVTTTVTPPVATDAPFRQRHPTASNVIFAAVCVYVAMIWLLALDQTFRWGIWGPQGFTLWNNAAHGSGP